MKKYLVILLAAMMIVACKKEKTAPTLSLSPTDLEFSSKGGSKTVKVQTNTDWTLTPDGADWYTVSPTQGSGVTDVTVTLNDSRNVIFHINGAFSPFRIRHFDSDSDTVRDSASGGYQRWISNLLVPDPESFRPRSP